MKNLVQRLQAIPEFILFLLAGGMAAVVNVTSRMVYSLVLNYSTAIVCAYLTGMVAAYFLMRLLVFKRTINTVPQSATWFVLVNMAAVAQTWVVTMAMHEWALPKLGITWNAELLAHAAGVAAPVFSSYLGHKYFSFKT